MGWSLRRCNGCLPPLKGGKLERREKQPFINEKHLGVRGGSPDGYGIKVPKV
jgi:hypothetical protein